MERKQVIILLKLKFIIVFVIRTKISTIELIPNEWKNLPSSVQESDEGKRLQEVVTVFEAWFSSYLDLLMDYNKRFNERMRELEKDLFEVNGF